MKVVASNGMKLECCVKVKKTIQIHKNKVKVEVKSEIEIWSYEGPSCLAGKLDGTKIVHLSGVQVGVVDW